MGLTESDDAEVVFGNFHDLVAMARTAFGDSIRTEDLFQLLFLTRISGYDFQVQTAKLNDLVDFGTLESSIMLESETRKLNNQARRSYMIQRIQPFVKQTMVMSPCGHSSNKRLEGKCRECEPCDLGVKSK